jgi:hypothetical protein
VKTIFGINNKQFVCKEIKQTVTEKGLDELIVGIFYPVD